jgi:hypothetical protein
MMEKTTPTTVMIAAAMVVRICRAASALPLITQPGSPNSPRYAARSAASVPMNSPIAATTSRDGTNHRLVRSTSRRQCDASADEKRPRYMAGSPSVIHGRPDFPAHPKLSSPIMPGAPPACRPRLRDHADRLSALTPRPEVPGPEVPASRLRHGLAELDTWVGLVQMRPVMATFLAFFAHAGNGQRIVGANAGGTVGEGLPGDTGGVPPPFALGSRIAGYRLEEEIGVGGMAVVFRALDERLDRFVALKLLTPWLAADEDFRHRFLRESRAAAAVDDPHIIPVYEAGEASGVLFISMRYVSGGSVRDLMRRAGPLPAARAAAVLSPLASSLAAARAAGWSTVTSSRPTCWWIRGRVGPITCTWRISG